MGALMAAVAVLTTPYVDPSLPAYKSRVDHPDLRLATLLTLLQQQGLKVEANTLQQTLQAHLKKALREPEKLALSLTNHGAVRYQLDEGHPIPKRDNGADTPKHDIKGHYTDTITTRGMDFFLKEGKLTNNGLKVLLKRIDPHCWETTLNRLNASSVIPELQASLAQNELVFISAPQSQPPRHLAFFQHNSHISVFDSARPEQSWQVVKCPDQLIELITSAVPEGETALAYAFSTHSFKHELERPQRQATNEAKREERRRLKLKRQGTRKVSVKQRQARHLKHH